MRRSKNHNTLTFFYDVMKKKYVMKEFKFKLYKSMKNINRINKSKNVCPKRKRRDILYMYVHIYQFPTTTTAREP